MTEEAKWCVEMLREGACCSYCSEAYPSIDYPFPCEEKTRVCNNMDKAADLIESLSEKNSILEYTLIGVMHFVDKWLNNIEPYSTIDDPNGQIAVERAAEARRITLEYIEGLQKHLEQVTRERDAALEDLKDTGMLCAYCLHEKKSIYEEPCNKCSRAIADAKRNNWQWRGVK